MQGFKNAVLLSCAPWCSLMHSLVTGHFHFQKRLCQEENFSHMGLCSWKSISVPSIVKKAVGFSAPHWQRRLMLPWTLPPKPRGRSLYPFLSSLPWAKEARALQLLDPTVTALCCQCRHTDLDKTDSSQCQKKLMACTGVSPGSSSISQNSTSQRQGSCLSCLQPWQLMSPGHAPLSLHTHSPPPLSSYHTTPACSTLVPYIWQSFPSNSHPSSKETMQRYLNHPQIPVAREWCSINEAAPAAMRTLLSSSAIKNSMRLSLNAESKPFTWRTQPLPVDLWRRSLCIPCDSKVWHGDGAVHC